MEKLYYHKEIEAKIQSYWENKHTFLTTEAFDKEKYYCLSMFPYPSGKLHMGHIRSYTIGDVISRFQRMQGKAVLNPIGWDAFGLPAENAAVNNKSIPSEWIYNNILRMRIQLKAMGFSYDWSREIITSNPEFYKWEQWFFIYLYNKGLAYKTKAFVNWCSIDKTVLANEQAINGVCWRCNKPISFKVLSQWFIKTTSYASELLKDLDYLSYWSINIKDMQRNWLGNSKGIEVVFKVFNKHLKVYSINPENMLKATYLKTSAYHCLSLLVLKRHIKRLITDYLRPKLGNIHNYQEEIDTELFAICFLTNKRLSVWASKHIIKDYGTGINIGTPSIYIEDFVFAIRNRIPTEIYLENSSTYGTPQKNDSIVKSLTKTNKTNYKLNYELKDWGISRQRYWGSPIPMYLKPNKIEPVVKKELPALLDENLLINKYKLVANIKKNVYWNKTTYKGKIAFRESDTFDTFLESSWYYVRYACPGYIKGMIDIKTSSYWLIVDQYIGGVEHAVMHLLYLRTYHKLLRDAGLVGFSYKEPVRNLLCQGMVLSEAFYYVANNNISWVSPLNVVLRFNNKTKLTKAFDLNGKEVFYAGVYKMSKSKYNGISPGSLIESYGADALRLFIMFAGPANIDVIWKQTGIEGSYRFLCKVWKLIYEHVELKYVLPFDINSLNKEQLFFYMEAINSFISIVKDIEERHLFNTTIAAIMKIVNSLTKRSNLNELDYSLTKELIMLTIKMLSPFAPHICSILWLEINNIKVLEELYWSNIYKTYIEPIKRTIIVYVNNKVRGIIEAPLNTKALLIKEKIYIYIYGKLVKQLEDKTPYKLIYIPNKIINILV